jgi:hypothetical protein
LETERTEVDARCTGACEETAAARAFPCPWPRPRSPLSSFGAACVCPTAKAAPINSVKIRFMSFCFQNAESQPRAPVALFCVSDERKQPFCLLADQGAILPILRGLSPACSTWTLDDAPLLRTLHRSFGKLRHKLGASRFVYATCATSCAWATRDGRMSSNVVSPGWLR